VLHGSRSREDGEVQTDDDEDIGDVDADVGDLVKAKTAGPLPPSLVFGESKITTNLIREYEKPGSSLRALGEPHLTNKSLPLRMERLLSFVISSSVDSDSPATRFCRRFWMLFR
jgi:hypothetical protein